MMKNIILAIAAAGTTPVVVDALKNSPENSVELMAACIVGAAISGIYSLERSKKDKSKNDVAAIKIILAVMSGLSAGYFCAKLLSATSTEHLSWLRAYPPFTAWALSLAGAQFVEWIMQGGLMRKFRREIGDHELGPKYKISSHDAGKVKVTETGTFTIIKGEDDV